MVPVRSVTHRSVLPTQAATIPRDLSRERRIMINGTTYAQLGKKPLTVGEADTDLTKNVCVNTRMTRYMRVSPWCLARTDRWG